MKNGRRVIQFAVLTLTVIGVFLLHSNAERWCPFGGIEALYTYWHEGNLLCSLGISNFYVMAALIVSVLVVRRAFCGYLCPIGAISDWLRVLADRLRVRGLRVPASVDRTLSFGKYLLLASIVAATWQAGELVFRGYCPAYALLGRHGADITRWAYVVAGTIALASLVVAMPFCRWFCPLAAALNPLSRFGLARIKRESTLCSDCGRCRAACPMAIPVDQALQVRHSRCLTCMSCIEACQSKGHPLCWGPPNWLGHAWPQSAVIAIILACGSIAVAAAYLAPLPSFVKIHGVAPDRVTSFEMRVRELTCRGRANLLVGLLERDDLYQIPGSVPNSPGYYKLEAWPDPITAVVRISYDPACADENSFKQAITEPYYDMAADRWWQSPFLIEGYNPPGLDTGTAEFR
jgi:hypothetical protein